MAAGCTVDGEAVDLEEIATDEGELRSLTSSEILGTLAYGESSGAVVYTSKPYYRAFAFQGAAGDEVEAWVRSKTGDARAWIVSDSFRTLASNDDAAPGTKDSKLTVTLTRTGTHYVVFRDARSRKHSFVVELAKKNAAPPWIPAARIGTTFTIPLQCYRTRDDDQRCGGGSPDRAHGSSAQEVAITIEQRGADTFFRIGDIGATPITWHAAPAPLRSFEARFQPERALAVAHSELTDGKRSTRQHRLIKLEDGKLQLTAALDWTHDACNTIHDDTRCGGSIDWEGLTAPPPPPIDPPPPPPEGPKCCCGSNSRPLYNGNSGRYECWKSDLWPDGGCVSVPAGRYAYCQ